MLYDENYKRLFASRLMVEHLLRACVPDELLAAADLASLRKLSAEYISDELRKRHGDAVWRLRIGGRQTVLLVLLEFQSEDDRWMALRILTYTGLLYQELIRNEAPEVAARWLPAVLPIVLYHGVAPWTAAREMGELIAPVGPWLAPFQPRQGYYVLDDGTWWRTICREATCCARSSVWSRAARRRTCCGRWRRCRAGCGMGPRGSCSVRSWIGCSRWSNGWRRGEQCRRHGRWRMRD